MASIDFKKLKSIQAIVAQIRHNDYTCRIKGNHSNKDIDKTRTRLNLQGELDSKATYSSFKELIAEHDNNPDIGPQYKRKDRVLAYSLVLPIPNDIKDADVQAFMQNALKEIVDFYGGDNRIIINAYVHLDEQHVYVDPETKKDRLSMRHIHAIAVPLIDGKLNGKRFSSKANMSNLNKRIDAMSKKEFGIAFLTGEGKKSREAVESLKITSERALLERDKDKIGKDLNNKRNALERDIERFNEYASKSKETIELRLRQTQKHRDMSVKHTDETRRLRNDAKQQKEQVVEALQYLNTIQSRLSRKERERINDLQNSLAIIPPVFIPTEPQDSSDIPDFI